MHACRSHLVALGLLALLAATAAQAGGVLALNNKAQAAWSLVLPEPTSGEPSSGTIQVEVLGKVVATLSPGQRYLLPGGFKGLLIFQQDGDPLPLRLKLEDRNKQFQAFSIYRDPNFHGAPHLTLGANSAIDTFELTSISRARLAQVLDYDPRQYSLGILAEAFPARPASPSLKPS